MISRRPVLVSAIALLFGCNSRVNAGDTGHESPGSGAPVVFDATAVGPGPLWRGKAGSGFGREGEPVDPPRVTAKPAIHWWTPALQRFSSDLAVGVDADALNGVAYVEFFVEGGLVRVAAPTVFEDRDANDQVRRRAGYWITLSHTEFIRRSSENNAVHIYARATPIDVSMQPRVIGPLVLYPESQQHDFRAAVAPVGGDFSSVRSALDAAAVARAQSPLLTITQDGFYDLDDAAPGANATGRGYCVITAAPGVAARLGRSQADLNDPNSWRWKPGWDGMEFRGQGVTIDCRNLLGMEFGSRAAWFNGCRWTNSMGQRDTLYWNRSHQGVSCTVPSYWTDVVLEHISSPLQQQIMVTGCTLRDTYGDVVSGTHFVAHTYVDENSGEFFRTPLVSLVVEGPVGGTIERRGYSRGQVVLRQHGEVLDAIPIGILPASANFTVSQVAEQINAHPGWKAMVLNDDRGARWLENLPPTDVGSGVRLKTFIDVHADWWQGYNGGKVRENIIIRNNVMRHAVKLNAAINNDAGALRDVIVKGNVWSGGFGPTYLGGSSMSHYMFANNTHQGEIIMINSSDPDPTYSVIAQNVTGGVIRAKMDRDWPAHPPFVDNVHLTDIRGDPQGPTHRGNTSLGSSRDTRLDGCFVNLEAGDFRPAKRLARKLTPRIDRWDGRLNPRAENDAPGAWASGYGPPAWPS